MISMLRIRLFFSLIFFSVSHLCLSQTYGFLGKRHAIEFNLNNTYFFSTFVDNIYLEKNKKMKYNIHPEVSLSYTVTNQIDLGIRLAYDQVNMTLPYQLKYRTNSYNTNLTENVNGNSYDNYLQIIERNNIGYGYNIQVYLRKYAWKYIAPVGFYQQFSLGFNQIHFNNNDIKAYFSNRSLTLEEHEARSNTYSSSLIKLDLRKYYLLEISYFLGKHRIFNNGIYINSGFEISWIVNNYLRDKTHGALITKSYTYHYKIPHMLAKELQLAHLFEFKIGIGKTF